MAKMRVGILFGGRSSEHEVSIVSARSIYNAIDKEKFEVELIGILPGGKWCIGADASAMLDGNYSENSREVILPQNPDENRLISFSTDGTPAKRLSRLDVLFPVLHGTYGEDGTIQGLFELSGIPYVGAGVVASAVGMDKILAKELLETHHIPQIPFDSYLRSEWRADSTKILKELAEKRSLPLFVKPANTGSSVGITKAHDAAELKEAIEAACKFDRKFLVEPGHDVRELECAVLGNDDPEVSIVGEIIPAGEFYDYNSKYHDDKSICIIPANLSPEQEEEIRTIAVKTFKALDCAGLARVDFFLDKNSGKIYLNEVNTLPGFTPISMYPKLWEASGLLYTELITKLIDLAFERHSDRVESQYKRTE